jgi:NADH-quinone oxidoreductase subunit H
MSGSGSNAIHDLMLQFAPEGVPGWLLVLGSAGAAMGVAVAMVSVIAMASVWLERKVSGHIQCRYGPMYVGWHGWLQSIADGVKLMLKEDMIPSGADKPLFVFAPALLLGALFGAFCAYPLSPHLFFVDIPLGLFFILALSSLTTIGVVMAGWSSNSKWSLYGAMREAAQVVAYEIPLGVSLLVPVMVAGTFNLIEASNMQSGLFGMDWFVFRNPFMLPAFVLFFVAALAETKRAPFDLPEAESELVSGFLTEYSGIRWSFFFMEEYAAMFLMSAVAAIFWFGGFESPLLHVMPSHWAQSPIGQAAPWGELIYQGVAAGTLIAKATAGVLVMMWLRWTLPRLRIDQVMSMGYKYLTPLALVCVLGAGLWEAAKAAL